MGFIELKNTMLDQAKDIFDSRGIDILNKDIDTLIEDFVDTCLDWDGEKLLNDKDEILLASEGYFKKINKDDIDLILNKGKEVNLEDMKIEYEKISTFCDKNDICMITSWDDFQNHGLLKLYIDPPNYEEFIFLEMNKKLTFHKFLSDLLNELNSFDPAYRVAFHVPFKAPMELYDFALCTHEKQLIIDKLKTNVSETLQKNIKSKSQREQIKDSIQPTKSTTKSTPQKDAR